MKKSSKEKINHSFLSSSSSSTIYYTNMSVPPMKKYDSGFSETATTISSSSASLASHSVLEQILAFERIYYETLKEFISKYSRPLRRYLHPDEIVDLFQNIEKVRIKILKVEIRLISLLFRSLLYPNQLFDNVRNYLMQTIILTFQFRLSINHG